MVPGGGRGVELAQQVVNVVLLGKTNTLDKLHQTSRILAPPAAAAAIHSEARHETSGVP